MDVAYAPVELADLQVGDTVTYSFCGHEVQGDVWFSKGRNQLMVGGADTAWFKNESSSYKFVGAGRLI